MGLTFIKYFNLIVIMGSLNYFFQGYYLESLYFLIANIVIMIWFNKVDIMKLINNVIIFVILSLGVLCFLENNMVSFKNVVFIIVIITTQILFILVVKEFSDEQIKKTLSCTLHKVQMLFLIFVICTIIFQNSLLELFEYYEYYNNYPSFIAMLSISLFPFMFSNNLIIILYRNSYFLRTINKIINVVK